MHRNFFSAIVCFLLLPIAVWAQHGVKLTILHFNDNYEISPKDHKGGLAEMLTVLKQQRAKHKNTITTVAGDFLSPSLLSGMTKGKHMIEIFNLMGIDYISLGNHEFDFGPEVLKERIKESKTPWVSTNVLEFGKVFEGTHYVMVKEVDGLKIGFLGIVLPETMQLSKPGKNVRIEPITESAQKGVEALKTLGADVVIALTHLSIDQDRALARSVKGIHLILGGHDHNPITFYEHGVLIFKSGSDAEYLGVINLNIAMEKNKETPNEKNPKMMLSWCMIPIAGVTPDPVVASAVKKFTDEFNKELDIVIGKTLVELDSRRSSLRAGETGMGDLFADALRDALNAEVAVVNSGSLRGDRIIPANSDLTGKDVLKELPFADQVGVVVKLKGSDLKQVLENGVSQLGGRSGRFPQISGMAMRYNPKLDAGNRVVDVLINGHPLDPEKLYTVATTGYMLSGGDGYTMLANGTIIVGPDQGVPLSTLFIDYIQENSPIASKFQGRIKTE